MSTESTEGYPEATSQSGEEQTAAEAAPMRRVEVETGPLLPRWLSVLIYGVFVPFCVFGAYYMGRAALVQHKMDRAIRLLSGPWQDEQPPMDSQAARDAIDYLKGRGRNSLLYVIQNLLQDETADPRMGRAIVLRKAIRWELESRRRQLLTELLANMGADGEIDLDYRLPEEARQTLENLVKERLEHPSISYEERKITEVLQWVLAGRKTRALGPEKRRLKALYAGYEKKLLHGAEKRALRQIMREWEQSDDPLRRSAAEKFAAMLEGRHAALTSEESRLCSERADYWEGLFFEGRRRVSQLALELARAIEQKGAFLDHPELWDLVRLLQERYPPARENLAEAVFVLRRRKFLLAYLREFITKDAINPVMAVETTRLTKSEHEELLREHNRRRRLACIDVARRIALDYCAEPFDIRGVEPAQEDEFFTDTIIRSLEAAAEDEDVGPKAQQALDAIIDTCERYMH